MRHALPPRAQQPHRLRMHRPRPAIRAQSGAKPPVRLSDLVLAFLGVSFLGALGLMAGASLIGRALAP